MYSINNNVVIDHDGLFIYIAQVTPILTTMLRHLGTQSLISIGDTFTCDNEYFDNLSGYHGYHGHDMYIMRHLGHQEIMKEADHDAIHAFNKMNA